MQVIFRPSKAQPQAAIILLSTRIQSRLSRHPSRERTKTMFHYPDLDATVALWGAAVLTYATVRYYFFSDSIQIDLPEHQDRSAKSGHKRK